MSFKLSQRSLSRLEGVHPSLLSTVEKAIQLTKVDFGCSCGVRTIEEQKVLLAKGASTTMKLIVLFKDDCYSHAVDIFGFLLWRVSCVFYFVRWLLLRQSSFGICCLLYC